MAQIPAPGIPRRETVISDHLIEDVSAVVTDAETGTILLTKQHRFIPSCVMVNVATTTEPHVNLYLTEVTNVGNEAKGSITIAGGTTASDLNGDTFTLTDKDTIVQVFTFNNTDNVVTDGSIGLLTAADEATIMTRTKTSINNISTLDITAGTITVGSSTSATAVNAIDATGASAGIIAGNDVVFTINITTAAGGEGGTITITLQDSDSTGAIGAGANAIGIGGMIGAPGTAIADFQFAERIINAINGIAGDRVTLATSGRGTSGAGGITAAQGSSNTQSTRTMDTRGGAGNITALASRGGVDIIDVTAFTGGLATQILQVIQDITGSAGNTAINMAGVTGGSSTNFVDGNNYGKASFTASESFTGSIRLRAVSLQNEYIM